MAIRVVWLMCTVFLFINCLNDSGFLNIHTCSFTYGIMELKCQMNDSTSYRADRSNENMLILTLTSTVECKVTVDEIFFPDLKEIKILPNCSLVQLMMVGFTGLPVNCETTPVTSPSSTNPSTETPQKTTSPSSTNPSTETPQKTGNTESWTTTASTTMEPNVPAMKRNENSDQTPYVVAVVVLAVLVGVMVIITVTIYIKRMRDRTAPAEMIYMAELGGAFQILWRRRNIQHEAIRQDPRVVRRSSRKRRAPDRFVPG